MFIQSLAVEDWEHVPILTLVCSTHTHTPPTHKVLPALLKPLNLSPVFISLCPMCCWACASGRSAVPLPLSSLSSGLAAPHWCYWGLGRPSPASPWASCCSGDRTLTTPATPQTAGRAPPGTQTSPCRWGWAGRGTQPSCTWTSPSPWSPAWSTWHRCLKRDMWEQWECHQVVGNQ